MSAERPPISEARWDMPAWSPRSTLTHRDGTIYGFVLTYDAADRQFRLMRRNGTILAVRPTDALISDANDNPPEWRAAMDWADTLIPGR